MEFNLKLAIGINLNTGLYQCGVQITKRVSRIYKFIIIVSFAGYYCILTSASPTPTDNTTGNVCPTGHYCPEASYAPTACPAGYFQNDTAQVDMSDCITCLGGMFCQGTGNAEPSGQCSAGYYCPPGQNTSMPVDYR